VTSESPLIVSILTGSESGDDVLTGIARVSGNSAAAGSPGIMEKKISSKHPVRVSIFVNNF
jgi:hypothetical protein